MRHLSAICKRNPTEGEVVRAPVVIHVDHGAEHAAGRGPRAGKSLISLSIFLLLGKASHLLLVYLPLCLLLAA